VAQNVLNKIFWMHGHRIMVVLHAPHGRLLRVGGLFDLAGCGPFLCTRGLNIHPNKSNCQNPAVPEPHGEILSQPLMLDRIHLECDCLPQLFLRVSGVPTAHGVETHSYRSVLQESSDQKNTKKRLQGWWRRILCNLGRPRALNRLRCHDRAGGQSWRCGDGKTPSPVLRFGCRRFRHAAAGPARMRNRNRQLLRVLHSHVFAFRFCLWSCALARLRMHHGTSGNRERPQPCQPQSHQ